MPPSISIDGRGWCVSTNTGVWNGGFGPHQPRHSSSVPTSVHGPVCAPNLPRPMISAPKPIWPALGERVVDTDAPAVLADHRAPEPGGEHPLVQAFPGVAERGVERDAVAGPEPVQGDREVVDADLGHGFLRSRWVMQSQRRRVRFESAHRHRQTDVVQFSPELRERVADGSITVSYRLWSRPQVKTGGTYGTGSVTIEIDDMELVPFSSIDAEDLALHGRARPREPPSARRACRADPRRHPRVPDRVPRRRVVIVTTFSSRS